MWRYKTVARIFFVLCLVNFTLAGVARSLLAPVDLVQAAKDTTKELNPGILPANLDRNSVNPPLQAPEPPPEPADPRPTPNDGKFYNEEMKRRMKDFIIFSTFGASLIIPNTQVLQKEEDGIVSPGASTVNRDLITTRAFGVSQTLNEHPQDVVLRFLANLRNDDPRFLGVLLNRLLESLD